MNGHQRLEDAIARYRKADQERTARLRELKLALLEVTLERRSTDMLGVDAPLLRLVHRTREDH